MKFRDLQKQYHALKTDIDAAISAVIADTAFISGKQVTELEKQLAAYVGVKHCITCANGTDALHVPLMFWRIKEGDAVFVPSFTFVATAEVVSLCGATPVFVDIEEDTYNLDPARLADAIQAVEDEGKLTPRAIIPVDLFGLPANYPEIRKIAEKHNLKILEDGAQSFSGTIGTKRTGSFGDIAATSFFPMKPLGCYGDGGAIFTDDDEAASVIRSICVHGKGSFKYDNIRIGLNSRLDTLQAAILIPKLRALAGYEAENVNKVAAQYTEQLKDHVICQRVPEGCTSAWAQYTIRLTDREARDGLQKHLAEKDIPTFIYYPKPLHRQQAYDGVKLYQACPVTEHACERVISLPLHPYMEAADVDVVVNEIKQYLANQPL